MRRNTRVAAIAAILLPLAGAVTALKLNLLSIAVICLISVMVTAVTVYLFIRDKASEFRSVREEADKVKAEAAERERATLQRCEDLDRELALLQRDLDVERAVHRKRALAFRLVERTAPIVGGLADVAVDKTERGAASTMDDIFTLSEETGKLAEAIQGSLSSTSSDDGSLQSTTTDLKLDAERLDDVRHAQEEMEVSIDRSIALIGDEIAEATKLLSVIEDIMEKTNVLAINAAIQAAKAGAYGKGFGVIAGEIHKLSVATSDASQKIAENTQNVKAHFRDLSRGHHSFITESGTKLSTAVESIGDTVGKLESVTARIVRSVHDAAEVSEGASRRLEKIIENMQSHDAVQQVVTHMHSILADSLSEAESIATNGEEAPGDYDIEATLIAISGRHMTMKDEFEAVGNENYDHIEENGGVLPDGTMFKGSVTFF